MCKLKYRGFLGTETVHLLWKGQHFQSQPWHPAEVAAVLQPSVSSQVQITQTSSSHYLSLRQVSQIFLPETCWLIRDPQTLQATRWSLLRQCMHAKSLQSCPSCPCNSPGRNSEVGSQALLHGLFPNLGWTHVSCLLHWRVGSLPLVSPKTRAILTKPSTAL